MTQSDQTRPRPVVRSHSVYTVLAVVALLALLVGVVFVWYRGATLFGQGGFDAGWMFSAAETAGRVAASAGRLALS